MVSCNRILSIALLNYHEQFAEIQLKSFMVLVQLNVSNELSDSMMPACISYWLR